MLLTIVVMVLKYYIAVGLFDAILVKAKYWDECSWKLFLLAIIIWPRIVYSTLRYDHSRENE